MIAKTETFEVRTRGRGSYEITDEVTRIVRGSGLQEGIVTVFIRHTSASLVIYENADPSAREDLHEFLDRIAPDGEAWHIHTAEGPDDTASHLRMTVTRTSETIPVAGGRMALGTWQGIFLLEHRLVPHRREIVVTVVGTEETAERAEGSGTSPAV
ncbi:MAG: secondary thiamine-phosphate synthase enzyme YjbQ [Chthoniobacterales bacterium]